jgi:SpoVK/Ycf46/Vps4 family AAA+-type ATPase
LYGPPGTGKTAIAEALPDIYGDTVWIPHAIEVGGQIIAVYDPNVHIPVPESGSNHDGRWMRCQRPRVMAGGELTLEMLDLEMDPATRLYGAPLHMRANNGVLVIDDFGRQRVRPEELLNRWIIPLERRIDFLTLPGGRKFEIPFELFVVLATNLDPKTLADGAFLRRIPTKIKVDYVDHPEFHEIFRRVCGQFQLAYYQDVVDYIIERLTDIKEPLRACYPRDVVHHILWAARYESNIPELERASAKGALEMMFPREPALPIDVLACS